MDINKPCKVCGKKGKLTCDRCKKIVYCSRNCQFKDWNTHKLKWKAKHPGKQWQWVTTWEN